MNKHVQRTLETAFIRGMLFAFPGAAGYAFVVFTLEFLFTPPLESTRSFSGFGIIIYYIGLIFAAGGALTVITDKASPIYLLPAYAIVCYVAYWLEDSQLMEFYVYEPRCFAQIVMVPFLLVCGLATSVYVNKVHKKALDIEPRAHCAENK